MFKSKTSIKSILVPIIFCFLFIAIGVLGYVYLEHMDILKALYCTIVTLTPASPVSKTPIGEFFSILLVFSGLGIFIYLAGRVGALFIEGELEKVLGRKTMEAKIKKMAGHYILCGFGRIGNQLYKHLTRHNIPLVVVENSPKTVEKLEEKKIPYVYGEATEEEILIRAGIERAKGLIAAVGSDADNVYIVLTARDLNPNLHILARATDNGAAKRLRQAGADKVVSSYEIGAKKLAENITHPLTTDFLDLTMSGHGELQIKEILVGHQTKLDKNTIAQLKETINVVPIVLRKKNGEIIFNPLPDVLIETGDALSVLGKQDDLERLEELLGAVPSCLSPPK